MNSIVLKIFLIFSLIVFTTSDADTTEDRHIVQVIDLRRKPRILGYWSHRPDIVVCESSPVTLSHVARAARFWERQGFEFGEIISDDGTMCLNSSEIHDRIFIRLVGNQYMGSNMALTTTYKRNDTREIVGARIFLMAYVRGKERVLEHELGHALGWGHYNQRGHLMNSSWHDGGWEARHLEREELVERVREMVESSR